MRVCLVLFTSQLSSTSRTSDLPDTEFQIPGKGNDPDDSCRQLATAAEGKFSAFLSAWYAIFNSKLLNYTIYQLDIAQIDHRKLLCNQLNVQIIILRGKCEGLRFL